MIKLWLPLVRSIRKNAAYSPGDHCFLNRLKIPLMIQGKTRTKSSAQPSMNMELHIYRSGSSEAPPSSCWERNSDCWW